MEKNAKIRVFAPASIGNVGPGFDVLGLCLENIGDEIEIWKTTEPGVKIVGIEGDKGLLSTDENKNTASIPMLRYLEKLQIKQGVAFKLFKKMPFGSGLGSSAASAVAGAFAINTLFGNLLRKKELLDFALDGEAYASGSKHADNVAPSLLGGLVLSKGSNPIKLTQIPTPPNLRLILIYQAVTINTADARKVLPENYSLKTVTNQLANLAGLIAGMATNNIELIGHSLDDFIATPYRAVLIPNFEAMKSAAFQAGSAGFSISGSGPTCFAITDNEKTALNIEEAISNVLRKFETPFTIYHSKVNAIGAKEIRNEIL